MRKVRMIKRFVAFVLCMMIAFEDNAFIYAADVAMTFSTESEEIIESTEETEEVEIEGSSEASEESDGSSIGDESTEEEQNNEVETTESTESTESEEESETTEISEEDVPMAALSEDTEEVESKIRFDYQSDKVNIIVTLTNEADLPEDAELVVSEVAITEEMQSTVEEMTLANGKTVEGMKAFDIKFVSNGEEVQPGDTVKVQISLPDTTIESDAEVYHYNEVTENAEAMGATVTSEGDVEFDTPHFSTYIIVNTTSENVTVTIQHFLGENRLYLDTVIECAQGDKISEFSKGGDAYKIEHLYQITTESGEESEKEIDLKNNEYVVSSTTDIVLRVKYATAEPTLKENKITLFDYYTSKDSWYNNINIGSINTLSNYQKYSGTGNEGTWDSRIAIGCQSAHDGNKEPLNSGIIHSWWNTEKFYGMKKINDYYYDINSFYLYGYKVDKKGVQYKYSGRSLKDTEITGILSCLEGTNYEKVIFNYADPGLFNDKDSLNTNGEMRGKIIYDDYSMEFDVTGNQYVYNGVIYDAERNKVARAAVNDFFPLGSEYFGLRYDFTFSLGDYIGDLNYEFSGDDDLWVCLDGEVVLDLGGIHGKVDGSTDLWTVILEKNKYTEQDKIAFLNSEENRRATHTITVLYMERGGYKSNCSMNFTIPNVISKEPVITKVPTTTLIFDKIDAQTGKGLEGAKFTLYKNGVATQEIYSDENGNVEISGLRENTKYTLKETQAPDGYKGNDVEYEIRVESNDVNGKEELQASLLDKDGNTITQIENESLKTIENIQVAKEAQLVNWDDRTYDISLYASHNIKTEKTYDIVLAIDVSGSMPWFVEAPTGDTTTLAGLNNIPKKDRETLDKNRLGSGTKGVDAWNYTYYVKRIGEGNAYEYKPVAWDSDSKKWKFFKSGSNGEKQFDDGETCEVTDKEIVYIRGVNDQTKLEALEDAVETFVANTMSASPDSRIGVVTFAGGIKKEYKLGDITANNIGSIFDEVILYGGTNQTAAMEKALELFGNEQNSSEKSIILFSDGDFSNATTEEAANAAANEIKTDSRKITLYTAGIFADTQSSGAKHMEGWATSTSTSFLTASSEGLKNAFKDIFGAINIEIEGVIIKDYIDSRFEIVSCSEGGIIGKDEKGTYVVWENQKLSYAESAKSGLEKIIRVKAKDTYLGGNNIPTNISGISGVIIPGSSEIKEFPLPYVHVKIDFSIGDAESEIFLGEDLKAYYQSAEKEILDELIANGKEKKDLDVSGVKLDEVAFEWKLGDKTINNMENEAPTDTKNATIYTATVNLKPSSEYKELESMWLDDQYYGNPSSGVEDTKKSEGNNGKYTVTVKTGTITITKKINQDSYKADEGDPIFTFKVTNLVDNKVYYRTVRFDVNDRDTKVCPDKVTEENHLFSSDYYVCSAQITDLPQGLYKIEEMDTMGFSLDKVGTDEDKKKTNCNYLNQETTTLYAIGYTLKDNVESLSEHTDVLKSEPNDGHLECDRASTIFVNKKTRKPAKLTDTDVVKNSLVIGNEYKGNKDADNEKISATGNEEQ